MSPGGSRLAGALAEERPFVMPLEECLSGPLARSGRHSHLVTVQSVVVAAILEILANAAAHLEMELARDGHVAPVEEGVKVAAKEEAVVDAVLSTVGVGADVCRLQYRRW